jgi:hypothetical protein
MNVTLRSAATPDVVLKTCGADQVPMSEICDLPRLDQHIRTLQVARAWLKREQDRRGKEGPK